MNKEAYTCDQLKSINWEKLKNKTILITGATGLIGSAVIRTLDQMNHEKGLNAKIIALVRNKERGNKILETLSEPQQVSLVLGTVEELPQLPMEIHYVIHGASQTASRSFVDRAVETLKTALEGTIKLLELAKEKKVGGFVYLSSMEVYGQPPKGHKVTENEAGAFSPLNLRNSYPIGKIASESLCIAYAEEYGVPCKIARLTQTFGKGVSYSDNRIFGYFARCIKEKKPIVLKTRGETSRSYLSTEDAATAILTILADGAAGKIYNVADKNTYCSVAEMAKKVADKYGLRVQYDVQENREYLGTLYMDLDTAAIHGLGWKPTAKEGILSIYEEMMEDFIGQ